MFKVLHKDPPIPENLSHEGKEFLQCCFRRNPAERPTASELLDHPFIRNSSHYNKHGSIHSFAGIKVNVSTFFLFSLDDQWGVKRNLGMAYIWCQCCIAGYCSQFKRQQTNLEEWLEHERKKYQYVSSFLWIIVVLSRLKELLVFHR